MNKLDQDPKRDYNSVSHTQGYHKIDMNAEEIEVKVEGQGHNPTDTTITLCLHKRFYPNIEILMSDSHNYELYSIFFEKVQKIVYSAMDYLEVADYLDPDLRKKQEEQDRAKKEQEYVKLVNANKIRIEQQKEELRKQA
jgi:L-rhamnose mutarotase